MSKEFDDCLKRRKITEFERAKDLVSKELNQAEQDLNSVDTIEMTSNIPIIDLIPLFLK